MPAPAPRRALSTTASTATASSGTGSIATPSAASTAAVIASPSASSGGSPAFSTFESGAKVTADIPFYNGTLTVDMLQNPQGLDPQVNSNNESFMAMLELYEQLIDYDPQSDMYYPQLVEEMPDVSNPQVYSFKLRQGMKFHRRLGTYCGRRQGHLRLYSQDGAEGATV